MSPRQKRAYTVGAVVAGIVLAVVSAIGGHLVGVVLGPIGGVLLAIGIQRNN